MGRATINETRQNETVIIRWSTLEKPRTARLIVQSFEKTQNKAEVCPAITRFPFKCETIGLELQSRNHQSNRFLMNSQHLRGHCAEGGKMQNVSAASFARGHTTSVFLSSSGTQIKRPVSSARGRAADCICVQTHLCSCCVIRAEGKHCHCGGFFYPSAAALAKEERCELLRPVHRSRIKYLCWETKSGLVRPFNNSITPTKRLCHSSNTWPWRVSKQPVLSAWKEGKKTAPA